MAWTDRYVRADAPGGGDGTTNSNSGVNAAWTLAEGLANEAAGVRLNVVGSSGTFASAATSLTFAAVGTTTAPIWWRGCNTTPGDLDTNQALAKPALTFTTGQLSVTGAHHIFTDLNVSGATTAFNGLAVNSSAGSNCAWDRCSFTNTGTNSQSLAYHCTGSSTFSECTFVATSSAVASVSGSGDMIFDGCDISGGGVGLSQSGGILVMRGGTIHNTSSHGYEMTSGTSRPLFIEGATFSSCGGDGIRLTALPTSALLAFNAIGGCGGYAINNNTGTATNIVKRKGNSFPSTNTSGNENGFGDSPAFAGTAPSTGGSTIVVATQCPVTIAPYRTVGY